MLWLVVSLIPEPGKRLAPRQVISGPHYTTMLDMYSPQRPSRTLLFPKDCYEASRRGQEPHQRQVCI